MSLFDVEVELREDTASRSSRERDESQQNEQDHEAAERHDREAVMTATEAQMQRFKRKMRTLIDLQLLQNIFWIVLYV